jgi:acyl-CoA reductase-like NAD-dependent aldehyde dehydrogenase
VGSAAAATREDARAAAEAVQAAFPGWSATPPAERRRLVERAGDLPMERQAVRRVRLVVDQPGL